MKQENLNGRTPLLQRVKEQSVADYTSVSVQSKAPLSPVWRPKWNKKRVRKGLQKYEEDQAELVALYAIDDAYLAGKRNDDEDASKTRLDFAVSRIVLLVNVGLLIAKGFAVALTTGISLSIVSTLLDSVFDITSGLVIGVASWAILNTDMWQYPRGRKDLELIAIMAVGLFMGGFNLFIIYQSTVRIINKDLDIEVTLPALCILLGTVITKAILFVLCWKIGTPSLLILAIDQRNDVMTNIVAMGGAYLSNVWTPYADAVAACLISGYIVYSWGSVVFEQIPLLTGIKCTRTEYARVTRVIIEHHEWIRCVDALLVYHTGPKCRVEAHVVLDPNTLCRDVHDEIEEPLKRKLEMLPFVDRAFVHPDYECDFYE